MNNVNYFDIIVLILVFFLGLKGLFRGFIKEAFGLAGIVGGVYVASRVSDSFGVQLAEFFAIESVSTAILIAFIAVLAAIWLLIYFVGMAVSKASEMSGLGIFDRFLGFVFGASKIFLIFSIIVYALTQVDFIKEKIEKKAKNSVMFPILKATGDYIVKLDPSILANKTIDKTSKSIEGLKETAKALGAEAKEKALETQEDIKEKIEESKEENSDG